MAASNCPPNGVGPAAGCSEGLAEEMGGGGRGGGGVYVLLFLSFSLPSEISDKSCSFAAVLARSDSKQGVWCLQWFAEGEGKREGMCGAST